MTVAELSLKGMNILAIILQETFLSKQLLGDGHFDSRIAQSFSQSSCHQHESSLIQLLKASLLVLLPGVQIVVANCDALRFADDIVGVGIEAKSGLLEQSDGVGVIGPESSGVGSLDFKDLGV